VREASVYCEILPPDVMLPAVGQGALAVECRVEDAPTRRLLSAIHDEGTARAVLAERTFLAGLGGGCRVPIAAYAETVPEGVALTGMVADAAGTRFLRERMVGNDAESVGRGLSRLLLERGAAEILDEPLEGRSS